MCACTAEQPMVRVCALAGLPGGRWQIVHLLGSLAPLKSGVAVGVGLSAFAIGASHRPKAKRAAATTSRIDPPIRRHNSAPFIDISNFFIEALCNEVTSILSALGVGQQKFPGTIPAERLNAGFSLWRRRSVLPIMIAKKDAFVLEAEGDALPFQGEVIQHAVACDQW